jgi:ABC-type transport system involved in multi-copper enzyme maturation permease subunit
MAVVVLLSVGLLPLLSLPSGSTFYSGGTAVMEYYSGGEYHFLGYSYNGYGQPVAGTRLNLTFSGPGAPSSSAASTNSSGFAQWTVPGSAPGGQLSYIFRVSGNIAGEGVLAPSVKQGEVNFIGGDPAPFVQDPANSSRNDVLFFYEGPNGTLPTMYRIYYNYSSSQGFSGPSLDESSMTLLGAPTAFVSIFKLPPPPPGTVTTSIGVFGEDGTLVSLSSHSQVVTPFTPPTPTAAFTSFASSILSLVVPLMAVLVSYNSYGKDRVSGVLESVLSRPVTRRGLGVTRYLSMVLSIAFALAITVGVMAVISQVVLGGTFPAAFAAYSIGGLLVEGAAFVGLMMLASHLFKSSGGLIGLGVVLWVFLDFLWGFFVLLAAAAGGVQIGSGDYLSLTIRSAFANPAQFYSLVGEYLNGLSLVSGIGAGTPISPATYGITPLTLAGAAAFWVLVPLGAFLYLAVKRD